MVGKSIDSRFSTVVPGGFFYEMFYLLQSKQTHFEFRIGKNRTDSPPPQPAIPHHNENVKNQNDKQVKPRKYFIPNHCKKENRGPKFSCVYSCKYFHRRVCKSLGFVLEKSIYISFTRSNKY